MTEMYTKEPWRIDSEPFGAGASPYFIVGASRPDGTRGLTVAHMLACGMYANGTDGETLDIVNARRIVACVNACAGIPTGALEAGAVAELIAATNWMDHYAANRDLRDVSAHYVYDLWRMHTSNFSRLAPSSEDKPC